MTFEFIAVLILSLFFVFVGWRQRQLDLLEDESKDKSNPINYPKIIQIITSLFVVVGAGEYSFAIANINESGFIGPTFLIGLGISLFIISKYIPKVYGILEKNPSYYTIVDGFRNFTTPDLFYIRFGRLASLITTTITVIAFFGLLVLQHVLGGELLSIVTGMSYNFCVVFMGIIVGVYVIVGGFKALFHTDVFQGLFMWFALIVLATYIFTINPENINYTVSIEELSNKSIETIKHLNTNQDILIYLVLTIIAAFGGPDLWQRANMGKNPKQAQKGVKYAAWTFILFIIPISIIAVDINALNISLEGDSLINYLRQLNHKDDSWNLFVKAVFGIGLVSAFVSTGDTAIMLVSTSTQTELRRWNLLKVYNKNLNRKVTNTFILLLSILAILVATIAPSIADWFLAVLGILAIMGLPVFAIMLNKGNKSSILFGLLAGIVIFVAQTYFLDEKYSTGWLILIPLLPALPNFLFKSKIVDS